MPDGSIIQQLLTATSSKVLVRKKRATVHSVTLRLYRVTSYLFATLSTLSAAKQYFGDPINCIAGTPGSVMANEKYVNDYCWFHGTMTYDTSREDHPNLLASHDLVSHIQPDYDVDGPGAHGTSAHGTSTDGVPERRYWHAFYQWVGFVLFLQGVCFYLPYYWWKSVDGGKIGNLVKVIEEKDGAGCKRCEEAAKSNKFSPDNDGPGAEAVSGNGEEGDGAGGGCKTSEEATRSNEFSSNKDGPAEAVSGNGEEGNGKLASSRLGSKLARRFGSFKGYAVKYVALEIGGLVGVVLHFVFIDLFLRGQFADLALRFLRGGNVYRIMGNVFPRVTACSVRFSAQQGEVQNIEAVCVLPLNIINEKIYVFLWFWLLLVTAFALVQLVAIFFLVASSFLRAVMLRNVVPDSDSEDIGVITHCANYSDWLVTWLVLSNLEDEDERLAVLRALTGGLQMKRSSRTDV